MYIYITDILVVRTIAHDLMCFECTLCHKILLKWTVMLQWGGQGRNEWVVMERGTESVLVERVSCGLRVTDIALIMVPL